MSIVRALLRPKMMGSSGVPPVFFVVADQQGDFRSRYQIGGLFRVQFERLLKRFQSLGQPVQLPVCCSQGAVVMGIQRSAFRFYTSQMLRPLPPVGRCGAGWRQFRSREGSTLGSNVTASHNAFSPSSTSAESPRTDANAGLNRPQRKAVRRVQRI